MTEVDKTCCVYVIGKITDGLMTGPSKIGISNNLSSRLATIQTSCPFKIDYAYMFECPEREWALALERSFHVTQRALKIQGEWFDIEPLLAVHLLCISYRALVATKANPEEARQWLDYAGVFWAEKRFNLGIPKGSLQ
jgi:hypothetical protein